MKKHVVTAALVAILGGTMMMPAAIAQTLTPVIQTDLNRAKNWARQAGEQANGGLNNYRAESAMHGPASEAPHVTNDDGSWTFTFTGTVFGATRAEDRTVETVVTVTPDSQVTLDYNGPVR